MYTYRPIYTLLTSRLINVFTRIRPCTTYVRGNAKILFTVDSLL